MFDGPHALLTYTDWEPLLTQRDNNGMVHAGIAWGDRHVVRGSSGHYRKPQCDVTGVGEGTRHGAYTSPEGPHIAILLGENLGPQRVRRIFSLDEWWKRNGRHGGDVHMEGGF